MKQNFRLLDVKVQVMHLKKLEGYYLQNIYNLGPQTLFLKLSRPGESKQHLLIDAGRRIHLTGYARTLPNIPSNEVMKIRMHLRSKRLAAVTQIGDDRIIEMRFEKGGSVYTCYLQIQLFSSGTIIMYDHARAVLLRLGPLHRPEAPAGITEKHQRFVLGKTDNGLVKLIEGIAADCEEQNDGDQGKSYCGRRRMFEKLKCVIGNELTDLIFRKSNIAYKDKGNKNAGASAEESSQRVSEAELERLKSSADSVEKMFNDSSKETFQGWVLSNGNPATSSAENMEKILVGFYPYDADWSSSDPELFVQHFNTFNDAVDYYFYVLECAKMARDKNDTTKKKLGAADAARAAQELNVKMLEVVSGDALNAAIVLERNLEIVDKLLNELRICFEDGWDWTALGEFIEERASAGVPQAQIVHKINYADRKVIIKLNRPADEKKLEAIDSCDANIQSDVTGESSSANINTSANNPSGLKSNTASLTNAKLKGSRKKLMRNRKAQENEDGLLIELDVNISALSNLTNIYGQKRNADTKKSKTVNAINRVVRKVNKKTSSESPALALKPSAIAKIRTPYWFENLIWSISPENYLIVSGADPSKKDVILRKYMSPNDIVVSGDIEGAFLVLIKNTDPDDFVGMDTLNYAGAMALCYSKAWSTKTIMSPWWVHPHQIITNDSTGAPFDRGVFFVEGEKNWLPYVHLVYGLGIMFRIAEESQSAHRHERVPSEKKTYIKCTGEVSDPNSKLGSVPYQAEGASLEGAASSDIKDSTKQRQNASKSNGGKNSKTCQAKLLNGHIDSAKKYTPTRSDAVDNNKKKKEPGKGRADANGVGGSISKSAAPTVQTNTKVRGKHGKMKKIKSKYQDQDEEDKILFELLSNPGGTAPGNLSLSSQNKTHTDNSSKIGFIQQSDALNTDITENSANSDEPAGKNAHEERRRRVREPFVYDSSVLYGLTALPGENDNILFALPVCGPWSVIKNYKYKVELLPGNMKRSAAARSCIHTILNPKNKIPSYKNGKSSLSAQKQNICDGSIPGDLPTTMTEAEKNAILLISEKDLLLQIPANVKLGVCK